MALPLLTSPIRTSTLLAAVAGTLALLPSCEKLQNGVVNEIEFPEHQPRLAVNMFVSPGDSVVYATVYQSAGVTDSIGSQPLRHAAVSLLQGNTVLLEGDSSNWAEFPTGPWMQSPLMKMVLDAPLQLQPGAVTLVVDASPTFEPLVISEEVPEVPVVGHEFEAYADTVDEGWGYTYFRHRVTVDLENRPGERDDYMVFVEYRDDLEGSQWYNDVSPAFPDPRLAYNDGCQCLLVTDSGEDNVALTNLVLESWAGDEEYTPEGSYRLRVERPTPSLANHFNSVQAYYGALDNPFSEPASIQGNIPDGFGIFGVTSKVVIPLQD